MRSVGGVLGGMSLKRTEPLWTHVSAYKLKQSLKMGNFGTNSAAPGNRGGLRGEG